MCGPTRRGVREAPWRIPPDGKAHNRDLEKIRKMGQKLEEEKPPKNGHGGGIYSRHRGDVPTESDNAREKPEEKGCVRGDGS